MNKKKLGIITATAIILLVLCIPMLVPVEAKSPAWHQKIISQIEILGLCKPENDEYLQLTSAGHGGWNLETDTTHYYLVFRRKHGYGMQYHDLQGHIELAWINDHLAKVEIYHSWENRLTIKTDLKFTVVRQAPFLTVYYIEIPQ